MPVGGHDILQPLIAGRSRSHSAPTLIASGDRGDALDAGVVWVVTTPQELARRSLELMKDAGSGDGYAANAVSFVSGRRGASQRCAEEAARLLGEMQPLRTHGVGKAVGKS